MKIADYKDTLYHVYELANKRSRDYHAENAVVNLADIDINSLNDDSRDDLYAFLNDLDFETIKVIQTVMYIGRDYKTSTDKKVKDPDLLLREWMSDLNWDEKDAEISQICSKMPLDSYLNRAFEILNIDKK